MWDLSAHLTWIDCFITSNCCRNLTSCIFWTPVSMNLPPWTRYVCTGQGKVQARIKDEDIHRGECSSLFNIPAAPWCSFQFKICYKGESGGILFRLLKLGQATQSQTMWKRELTDTWRGYSHYFHKTKPQPESLQKQAVINIIRAFQTCSCDMTWFSLHYTFHMKHTNLVLHWRYLFKNTQSVLFNLKNCIIHM